jgi:Spy/CpxP family protein refolding chaperone
MMHDRLQEALNELNLTDDQKGKLKDVFADAKSKRESIMSDASLTADQKKEKMKALHQDTMAKVNDVLTPDQRTQLKEKLEAAKKAPDSNSQH